MKHLKNILVLALALTVLWGCSDDEENNPSYEFKNQNLQGKIDGQTFIFKDGRFAVIEDELDIDLYSELETDSACNIFAGEHIRILFGVPNQVELVELSFNLTSLEDSQTITLFNPENTLNTIATEGAVEILSITDTKVTGRMDARADDDNFVNGNFEISICD